MREMKNGIDKRVAGKKPAAAPAPENDAAFQTIVDELQAFIESGEAPEGFELEDACRDGSFMELVEDYGVPAAARIWAAEKRASEAERNAKSRLDERMQQRRGLPRPSAGGGYAAPKADYANMDSATFRKLSEEFRRAARDGKRVPL